MIDSRSVFFLVGPTAVGKSAVALLLAQRLNAEIVSADSMLVYRGMDIGTDKPSARDRRRVPHHLMDLVSTRSRFDAARFQKHALHAIRDILSRGKRVMVVGGTGLYIRSLLAGIFEGPGRDPVLRQRLAARATLKGPQVLWEELRRRDPAQARKIHAHDTRRLVRALEVIRSTRRPMSAWQKTARAPLVLADGHLIGLTMDRAILYARVNKRVGRMIRQGWPAEVRRLKQKGMGAVARQAIGYSELLQVLKGKLLLDDAVPIIQQRTRRLVKAQVTWFRHQLPVEWLEVGERETPPAIARRIWKRWNQDCS